MFNQDLVEQISDDFQSTFKLKNSYVITNIAFPREIPEIIEIINKYMPGKQIQVTEIDSVGPKNIYEFEIV